MLTSESLKSEIAILIVYGDTNKRKTLDWLAAAELKGADLHQPRLRWAHVMINNPLNRQKSRANLLIRAQLSCLRAWPMDLIQFHEPLRVELFKGVVHFFGKTECHRPRIESRMPECTVPYSFIRAKFVDGFLPPKFRTTPIIQLPVDIHEWIVLH